MKLIDYINTINYFNNDFITLNKMNDLYMRIEQTHSTILVSSLDFNIKLSTIESSKKILLSSNPDLDFPRPCDEMLQYNDYSQYNQIQQNYLDKLPYEKKIDISQLDNIPEHIKHIYCNSVGKIHPKVSMVPIGRDFKNENIFKIVDILNKNDKTILCYYNCTLPPKNTYHWYGMIRQHLYDIIKKKTFIFTKKCDMHPRNYSQQDIFSYYVDLSKSRFMICPRGCGIDTYRMWDCIYMGCIPIVEKYEGYQQFEDLPVFYINSWTEVNDFTPELLEQKWNEMLEKDYNYDKLRMSYWENRILNSV